MRRSRGGTEKRASERKRSTHKKPKREEKQGAAHLATPSPRLPSPSTPDTGRPPSPSHTEGGACVPPMSSDDDPRGAPPDRAEALATAYGSPALRRGGVGRICESVLCTRVTVVWGCGSRATSNKALAQTHGEEGRAFFVVVTPASPRRALGHGGWRRTDITRHAWMHGRKPSAARGGAGAPLFFDTHETPSHAQPPTPSPTLHTRTHTARSKSSGPSTRAPPPDDTAAAADVRAARGRRRVARHRARLDARAFKELDTALAALGIEPSPPLLTGVLGDGGAAPAEPRASRLGFETPPEKTPPLATAASSPPPESPPQRPTTATPVAAPSPRPMSPPHAPPLPVAGAATPRALPLPAPHARPLARGGHTHSVCLPPGRAAGRRLHPGRAAPVLCSLRRGRWRRPALPSSATRGTSPCPTCWRATLRAKTGSWRCPWLVQRLRI